MARLYTISHGKGFLRTDNSYRSNLDIVNKETLVHVARRLGIAGVAKSHSKERLAGTVSGYVLSHPEECLGHLSVKELLLLKDFVDEGGDTSVVRPNRRYYDTLRELLFVSVYHDKKTRSLYFLLPDELRELFAPLIDQAIKEAKKREKAEKDAVRQAKSEAGMDDGFEYLDDDDGLSDDDLDDGWDDEWDDDDEDGFDEEVIGMGHRHYDSLGEFLSHLDDRDSFDSVIAVQDFWLHANVVNSGNAVVTLYVAVVYADRQTGRILYRSVEPVEVRIDTDDLNSITIPDLPGSCVSRFSTETEVMNYSYGVLTIEGKDKDGNSYVVRLI
jgi:hypothetical protein